MSWREDREDIPFFGLPHVEYRLPSPRKRDIILALIKKYLKEKNSKCFTYREFRMWLYSNKHKIEWHTVERLIRQLAREGKIERKWISRKKVMFCYEKL